MMILSSWYVIHVFWCYWLLMSVPEACLSSSCSRKSPPLTNGSLKTPRSARRRIATSLVWTGLTKSQTCLRKEIRPDSRWAHLERISYLGQMCCKWWRFAVWVKSANSCVLLFESNVQMVVFCSLGWRCKQWCFAMLGQTGDPLWKVWSSWNLLPDSWDCSYLALF